jgi:hypothetical protein
MKWLGKLIFKEITARNGNTSIFDEADRVKVIETTSKVPIHRKFQLDCGVHVFRVLHYETRELI